MTSHEDSVIQHRFIQIQQATALVPDRIENLWQIISEPDVSIISVSNACEKVVKAVKRSQLELAPTLQQLQNLVLVGNETPHLKVYLRSITRLVIWQAQQQQKRTSATKHPFVTLLRNRPNLYHYLLTEVDYCLEQCRYTYNEAMFYALAPFYDTVFLLNMGDFDPSALLLRFSNMLMVASQDFMLGILYYLFDIFLRYPSHDSQHSYLAIADTIINVLTFNAKLHKSQTFEDLSFMTNSLIYSLLQRAYDASQNQRMTVSYIERIERTMLVEKLPTNDNDNFKDYIATPNVHLIWCSLSYLLTTSSTVDDQYAIVGLLQHVISLEEVYPSNVLLIALLPLFQTLAELQDFDRDNNDNANEKCTSEYLKTAILDFISIINKTGTKVSAKDRFETVEKIQKEVALHQISGSLSHMVIYLCQYLHDNQSARALEVSSTQEPMSFIHATLFCVPFLFDKDESVRSQYLSHIVKLVTQCQQGPCLKFPVLLILIHLMGHTVTSADTLFSILMDSLPSLVSTNDLIITTKVLHIMLSLIHGTNDSLSNNISYITRETTMGCIAIKVMERFYGRQPRIWQELRKILSDWILRRKSNNGRPSATEIDNTGSIQVELAILTTMRDLCNTCPRECAPDILPMLISLLQACQYVHVSSLSLIVQTMCACIRTNMVEPRSLWLVSVNYIAQFALGLPIDQSSLLLQCLCEFFEVVGKKDENSELYIEFKQVILDDYLSVLIGSTDILVKKAALRALSAFPVPDMLALLPEKAKQYLDSVGNDVTNTGHVDVLVTLISYELDHMRRGFYMEEQQSRNNDNDSALNNDQVMKRQSSLLLPTRESQIGGQFVAAWENARTSPGLRSGYAIALLQGVEHHHLDPVIQANTMEMIVKTKWYRCLTTSLGDVGLTDHLLVRLASSRAWESFFGAIIVGEESDVEIRSLLLLEDLLSRLDRSTVPGQTCNIFLALTGLISTIYGILPSCATTCATQLIDIITTKYITPADVKSTSLLVTSDEVQYAARYCLGHISQCIIINEKMATSVLDTLLQLATQCRPTKRKLDAAVDLVHFSSGFAAAHFSSLLSSWPTKSSAISVLATHGVAELLAYCNDSAIEISESTCLGIMIGWASAFDVHNMKDIKSFARLQLEHYVGGSPVNLGLLLGAPWVCSYGAHVDTGKVDGQMADILSRAASVAREDKTIDKQHAYHFDVPVAIISRLQCIYDKETESSTRFNSLFLSKIQTIQNDDASSQQRIPALFTLGSLLGADYLSTTTDQEQLYKEAQIYNADIRRPLLDVMTTLAGLTDGLSAGNLKSGRISAVVCGQVVQKSRQLQIAMKNEEGGMANNLTEKTLKASSAEPRSYSRLNNNTSYLRAVFDSLVLLTTHDNDDGSSITSKEDTLFIHLLLSALQKTPGPLPPVNWFTLLSRLAKISTDTRVLCISFATTHAATSASLSEYILSELKDAASSKENTIINVLVGDSGIGRLLELSGLNSRSKTTGYKRRGVDAVTKKMKLSDIRATEIFEIYAKLIVTCAIEIQNLFLSTVKDYLPSIDQDMDEKKLSYITLLQDIIRYNVTYPLLRDRTTQLETVRLAVETSIRETDDLLESKTMKDWINDTSTAHLKVQALIQMCHLKQTHQPRARWITDTMVQIFVLISGSTSALELDEQCWIVLSDAIMESQTMDVSERLTWVVRLLDVLIVVVGMKKQVRLRAVTQGIESMIRSALAALWSQPLGSKITISSEVALADACYLLSYSIVKASGSIFERQIVKRIFKLVDLLSVLNSDDDNDVEAASTLRGIMIQALRSSSTEIMREHLDEYEGVILEA